MRSTLSAVEGRQLLALVARAGGVADRDLVDPLARLQHARRDLRLDREPALAEPQRAEQLGAHRLVTGHHVRDPAVVEHVRGHRDRLVAHHVPEAERRLGRPRARAEDDVRLAREQRLEHGAEVGRRVLEVGVEDGRVRAPRVLEPGANRRALAPVLRRAGRRSTLVRQRRLREPLAGAVGRAVVDDHELPRCDRKLRPERVRDRGLDRARSLKTGIRIVRSGRIALTRSPTACPPPAVTVKALLREERTVEPVDVLDEPRHPVAARAPARGRRAPIRRRSAGSAASRASLLRCRLRHHRAGRGSRRPRRATTSATPPTRVATTGRPDASVSIALTGVPSLREGRSRASNAWNHGPTSSWKPTKRVASRDPELACERLERAAVGAVADHHEGGVDPAIVQQPDRAGGRRPAA